MKILFLSISAAISNLDNRGIYPDLLRKFAQEKHEVYIVCPSERRQRLKTQLRTEGNVHTLAVQTLNITKVNVIEKGMSILSINYLFYRSIKRHLPDLIPDLILYSTPPITFNKLIEKLKKRHKASSYLLLKDIFPQNAVDLGILPRWTPFYHYFREQEKRLYKISDYIGCMSLSNKNYVIKNNPFLNDEKVEVCPNSISPNKLCTSEDSILIRDKYNIPTDSLVFIYGGNLGKPQGVDFLIEVLASQVKRKGAFFVIVGSGQEAHKIRSYKASASPSNVLVLPSMPKRDYDQLLSACDVGMIFLDKRFTIPNFPSRLLNYLEYKKPVLMATDCYTDIGKIAVANDFGLWVESGKLEAFKQKINYFINNRNRIPEMGEKGYQFLLENYTVEISYNTIIAHFT